MLSNRHRGIAVAKKSRTKTINVGSHRGGMPSIFIQTLKKQDNVLKLYYETGSKRHSRNATGRGNKTCCFLSYSKVTTVIVSASFLLWWNTLTKVSQGKGFIFASNSRGLDLSQGEKMARDRKGMPAGTGRWPCTLNPSAGGRESGPRLWISQYPLGVTCFRILLKSLYNLLK